MNIRRTILAAVAALAPVAALADITWYAGLGAGGARLEQDLNITYAAYEYDSEGVLGPVIDRVGQGDPDLPFYNPRYGQPVASSLDKFNGTDVGYRVFAGAMVGRFVGLEVGYVNLGEVEDQVELNIPPVSGPTPDNILCSNCRPETDVFLGLTDEIDGWDAFVIGALPLGESFDVFAKLGVIGWESNFQAKNSFREQYPPSPPIGPGGVPDGVPYVPTTEPATFREKTDGTDIAGGLGVNYKATENMVIRAEGTWYDVDDVEQAWLLGLNLIITY
jgi:opacity protein-like surface antigen